MRGRLEQLAEITRRLVVLRQAGAEPSRSVTTMPKRAVHFLLLGGIGGSLALLVMWIDSPSRDTAEPSQIPIPLSPAPARGGSVLPEVPTLRAVLPSSGEPGELERSAAPIAAVILPTPTLRDTGDTVGDNVEAAGPPPTSEGSGNTNGPAFTSGRPNRERPLGWCFYTTLDGDFRSDSDMVWNGSRSVLIGRHEGATLPDLRVNALTQGVDATPYRDLRIQLSVHVKTSGLVFVFLHTTTVRELAQESSYSRIAPSTNRYFQLASAEWIELSIIADIPGDADVMSYGVAHNGGASLWVDDVRLTEAGPDSTITPRPRQDAPGFLPMDSRSILPAPANLSFEMINPDRRGPTTAAGPEGA